MQARLAEQALYPERDTVPEAWADRLFADLGFHFGRVVARFLPEQSGFATEVGGYAREFRAHGVAASLPGVRYRVRRDGLRPHRIAERLGLCCAVLAPREADRLAPHVLGAAALLMQGWIAELSDPLERVQALTLASVALAVHGEPVHVLTASDARAARLAALLRVPLDALGMGVSCVTQQMPARERRTAYAAAVVCCAHRVVATDYLRDRMQLGRREGALRARLERLAGDAPAAGQLMLPGLHCALVEDADNVLLDEAQAPIMIVTETDPGLDRLLCEQVLELARALVVDQDFRISPEGVALTASGSERLLQLAVPLGSEWRGTERREARSVAALEVLHLLQRELDYRVEQGRVLFPEPKDEAAEPDENALLRRCLVEVKEGCKLSGRREVLARVSAPRFFRRYLHLAGTCADARGLESEYWSLYALKTKRAGQPPPPLSSSRRVFVSATSRREALVRTVRDLATGGAAVLVALRSPAEAQVVTPALAALERPDAVVVTLYPAHRDAQREAANPAPVHLVVAELHDAERHVAQIRDAYGASSCTSFLALDDDAVATAIGPLAAVGRLRASQGGELPAWLAHWIAARAQRGAERAQAVKRRSAPARERQMEELLAFAGRRE